MDQRQIDHLIEYWLERELDETENARPLAGPISDNYREVYGTSCQTNSTKLTKHC